MPRKGEIFKQIKWPLTWPSPVRLFDWRGKLPERIQSEDFELLAPFRRSVAEPLDTNAAGQTTFDRSLLR
jgi:hypothetical protein